MKTAGYRVEQILQAMDSSFFFFIFSLTFLLVMWLLRFFGELEVLYFLLGDASKDSVSGVLDPCEFSVAALGLECPVCEASAAGSEERLESVSFAVVFEVECEELSLDGFPVDSFAWVSLAY